jgi:hypothetical protein
MNLVPDLAQTQPVDVQSRNLSSEGSNFVESDPPFTHVYILVFALIYFSNKLDPVNCDHYSL